VSGQQILQLTDVVVALVATTTGSSDRNASIVIWQNLSLASATGKAA
jgi:hypothetical protein